MNQPPHQQPAWGQPQQPVWGAPPPQPPRDTRKASAIIIAILAVLVVAIVLASGSDDSSSKASPAAPTSAKPKASATTPRTPAAGQPSGIDKRQLTELSVGLVWDGYSESRRDIMCAGLEAYGKDWFAKQMESDSIDPDYAAELVAGKCELR